MKRNRKLNLTILGNLNLKINLILVVSLLYNQMVLSNKTTTTSVRENSNTNMSTSTINQNDIAIVAKCIAPFKELIPFQDLFVKIIATLEDDFLKEAACRTALNLLKSKMKVNQYMKKVKDLGANDASIPSSLRVKINLTYSEKEVMRTQEFQTLQSEAESLTNEWQKLLGNIFLKAKKLDRDFAEKQFVEEFFDQTSELIKMKAFFELNMDENASTFFENNNKYLAAAAWLLITSCFYEDYKPMMVDDYASADGIYKEMDEENYKWIYAVQVDYIKPLYDIKFKEKLFEKYDEAKAISILQAINGPLTNSSLGKNLVKKLAHFICTVIPAITIGLEDKFKTQLKQQEVKKLTLAKYNSNCIRNTTKNVAKALSKEESIDCKHMESLIEKSVKRTFNKFKGKQEQQKT